MKLYSVLAVSLFLASSAYAQSLPADSFKKCTCAQEAKITDKLISALMTQGSRPEKETLAGKYTGKMYKYGRREVPASMEIIKTKNGQYRLRIFPKPSMRIYDYFTDFKISDNNQIVFRSSRGMASFNSVTITRHGKYLLVKAVATEKSFKHTTNGYFVAVKDTETKNKN